MDPGPHLRAASPSHPMPQRKTQPHPFPRIDPVWCPARAPVHIFVPMAPAPEAPETMSTVDWPQALLLLGLLWVMGGWLLPPAAAPALLTLHSAQKDFSAAAGAIC